MKDSDIILTSNIQENEASLQLYKRHSKKQNIHLGSIHYGDRLSGQSPNEISSIHLSLLDWNRLIPTAKNLTDSFWDEYQFRFKNDLKQYIAYAEASRMGIPLMTGYNTVPVDMGHEISAYYLFPIRQLNQYTLTVSQSKDVFENTILSLILAQFRGMHGTPGTTLDILQSLEEEKYADGRVKKAYEMFYRNCWFFPSHDTDSDLVKVTRSNQLYESTWSLTAPGHIDYQEWLELKRDQKPFPIEFSIQEKDRKLVLSQ